MGGSLDECMCPACSWGCTTICAMPNTSKPHAEPTSPTQPTLAKSDLNLVWLDCEMSGLEPDRDRLLEIAVIVTSPDLSIRIEGPVLVIHQSDEVLSKMDAWNRGTHGKRRKTL